MDDRLLARRDRLRRRCQAGLNKGEPGTFRRTRSTCDYSFVPLEQC
jgi:hypothetical protein